MNKNISYYKDLIKKHIFTFFITFFIIFSLSLVYAYFAQKIYLSDAKVEVIKYKQNNGPNNNTLQVAIKENSPEDEAEILQSNFLVNKAINNLNFDIEFFQYEGKKHFAINEDEFPLYLEIFEIINKKLYDEKLNITPLNEDEYSISIDTSSFIDEIKDSKNNVTINEVYKYGELIENQNFKLLVTKKSDKE